MDIYERLEKEKEEKKIEVDKRYATDAKKLKRLTEEHPVFTEIFITGNESVVQEVFKLFHSERYIDSCLSVRIDFLHHLIHYHILDDGGYSFNPRYAEVKKYNQDLKERVEKLCETLPKDEKFDIQFQYRISEDREYSKKKYPPMYSTWNHAHEDVCNGDGDGYDEILENCKEFYDRTLVKEKIYRKNLKRHKEIFGH